MKKYALLSGINEYDDPTIRPLMCAENDAEKLGAFLKNRCGFDEVEVLKGQSLNSSQVIKTVSRMGSKMGPDDLFLYLFGGHGIEHPVHGHLLLLHQAQRAALDVFPQEVLPVRGLEIYAQRLIMENVGLRCCMDAAKVKSAMRLIPSAMAC